MRDPKIECADEGLCPGSALVATTLVRYPHQSSPCYRALLFADPFLTCISLKATRTDATEEGLARALLKEATPTGVAIIDYRELRDPGEGSAERQVDVFSLPSTGVWHDLKNAQQLTRVRRSAVSVPLGGLLS